MGIYGSFIGMHATSAIINVITNSKGCISPIWRFPMSRTTKNMRKKVMIDFMRVSNILMLLSFG